MHRSGTSAVTGALASLGLDLGREPLMEASPDNPTGHFEVGRLGGFNDEVLDALGGSWSAPPDAGADEVAALAATELGERAATLVADVFPDSGWVWKDPRTTLLLPFWRAVLRPDPAVVVVLRHPLEVARSLAARNGMALDYGLALWERYLRRLVSDLEGLPCLIVDYGEAMSDPGRTLTSLAAFVATAEPSVETTPTAGPAVLVGDHRHQRAGADELAAEPAASDELRELHRLVRGLPGVHRPFPAVELGPETPGLQMAFAEHKRLSRYVERLHEVEAELAASDRRAADLTEEIDRRSAHATAMVAGLEEERDSLAARLIELESWWPVLNAMRARRVLRRLGRRDPGGGA
jgi:hypothetical protein